MNGTVLRRYGYSLGGSPNGDAFSRLYFMPGRAGLRGVARCRDLRPSRLTDWVTWQPPQGLIAASQPPQTLLDVVSYPLFPAINGIGDTIKRKVHCTGN